MTATLFNIAATAVPAGSGVSPVAIGQGPPTAGDSSTPQADRQSFMAAMLSAHRKPSGGEPSEPLLPPDLMVAEATTATPLDPLQTAPSPQVYELPIELAGLPTEPATENGNPLPPVGNVLPLPLHQPAAESSAQSVSNMPNETSGSGKRLLTSAALQISMPATRPDALPASLKVQTDAERPPLPADIAKLLPAAADSAIEPIVETETLMTGRIQRAMEMLAMQANASMRAQAAAVDIATGTETTNSSFTQSSTPAGLQFDQLTQSAQLQTMRPLQPMANPDAFTQGLSQRLMIMSEEGVHSARLRLQPESLGTLDVKIQIEDDMARVWFTAQHGQTREAVEAAMPRLKDLFAEQGMQLVQADVESGQQHGRATEPFEAVDEPAQRFINDDADISGTPVAHRVVSYLTDRSLDIYV